MFPHHNPASGQAAETAEIYLKYHQRYTRDIPEVHLIQAGPTPEQPWSIAPCSRLVHARRTNLRPYLPRLPGSNAAPALCPINPLIHQSINPLTAFPLSPHQPPTVPTPFSQSRTRPNGPPFFYAIHPIIQQSSNPLTARPRLHSRSLSRLPVGSSLWLERIGALASVGLKSLANGSLARVHTIVTCREGEEGDTRKQGDSLDGKSANTCP